MSCTYEELIEF